MVADPDSAVRHRAARQFLGRVSPTENSSGFAAEVSVSLFSAPVWTIVHYRGTSSRDHLL